MSCIFHLVIIESAKVVISLAAIDLKKRLQNQIDETTKLDKVAQNLESKMKSIEANSEDFHNEISEITNGEKFFYNIRSD